MRGAAVTAAITAAVTLVLTFLLDQPWLAAAVIVLAGIAGVLIRLSELKEPPST